MNPHLTLDQARALIAQKLGTRPRAAHSLFVGAVMDRLARLLDADAEMFMLVGYCHDLDYYEINGNWAQHGHVTADNLISRLPEEALDAIRAHDHRAGVNGGSLLADMLKLADALAVLDQDLGRDAMADLAEKSAVSLVAHHLPDRPWLGEIIDRLIDQHAIERAEIALVFKDLSRQSARRD